MAAQPPLLALSDATLSYGSQAVVTGLSMGLQRGEKTCLVGRNGSGKSTLLKALSGEIDLDAGERIVQPGVRVAYLPQDPQLPAGESVAAFIAGGLPESEAHSHYLVEAALDRFRLEGSRALATLSGGEGRRAALARALLLQPEVLLLDEPTNHLDLPTIEALEDELKRFSGALLIISHDRRFLEAVSKVTLWLDRGVLRRMEKGFAQFEAWAEEIEAEEEKELQRLNTKLRREEHWLQRGVTARRKRNQGRLTKLKELRANRARLLRGQAGTLEMAAASAGQSGRAVIEVEHLSKSFTGPEGEPRPVVEDFSTRILRGDRIGIIGPNGAGKTTLVKLLTGQLAPDSGRVTLGTRLEIVTFDQRREQLEPEASLWENLVPGGGDSLMVGNRQLHVVGYLKQFLFAEEQARQPVKTLSGGEKNRLLLARLFAKPSNLMILDEPTNDLDLETLDLLAEVLDDYEGTLLVISHDRDFLDRVATSIIAVEGGGRVEEFPGGYSDSLAQRRRVAEQAKAKGPRQAAPKTATKGEKPRSGRNKLSYKDARELERLPGEIERLGARVAALQEKLADPGLYGRDPEAFAKTTEDLTKAQDALETAELRWLELEELREDLEGQER